ncbi:MAG TPA: chromate resistance protein ChrB domain-containing protein, partial [Vicinamibacterales bacterium]|nr:chromate resistance protein ChrB domain-containing protein [Vicinamibacterales bacterium]
EVLCAKFRVMDAGVREISEIVHDLDLKDGRFGRADAVQVGALVEGLRQVHGEDDELLEHGMALFEALYRAHSMPPPTRTARARAASSRRRRR